MALPTVVAPSPTFSPLCFSFPTDKPSPLAFPSLHSSLVYPHRISGAVFHGLSASSRRNNSGATRRSCSSLPVLQTPSQTNCGELELEECLERTSLALGLQHYSPEEHIVVTGKQVLFGMEGMWRLAWCMDGRFYEQYSGTEMTFEQGYDGEHNPWHADAGGRVSTVELDDMEIGLLVSWVRIGYWLTEAGRNKLIIQLEQGGYTNTNTHLAKELQLSIRLKNKKVLSYVTIDLSTWLPIRMESKALGSVDKWDFTDWQYILPGGRCKFPRSTLHFPPAGGKGSYSVVDASVGYIKGIYLLPNSTLVPRHNKNYPRGQIDKTCPSSVKLIRTKSGHYLVRPYINGKDIGYFILDTGASGLVISPNKANDVGMDAFGEVFVTGIEGKFKSQFRRGKSLQLGPLTIIDPIFLEAPMDGFVKGITTQVFGICGYDVFYHCIIEMSNLEGRLSLFDPLHYTPPKDLVKWENMYILDNVPHTEANFSNHSAVFLLDTGAGGVDVIFHKRAVEEFKLLSRSQCIGFADVNGMGSSSTGIKVQFGLLEKFEVAGQHFQSVKVLFFEDDGMLDLSVYTAGILCGNMLADYLTVFDYPNRRFALVRT